MHGETVKLTNMIFETSSYSLYICVMWHYQWKWPCGTVCWHFTANHHAVFLLKTAGIQSLQTNFTVLEYLTGDDIFATHYCCVTNKIHSGLYVMSFTWVARYILQARNSNYTAQAGYLSYKCENREMLRVPIFSRRVVVHNPSKQQNKIVHTKH